MAMWQFSAFLLPREPFEYRFGAQKTELPREDVLDDQLLWLSSLQSQAVLEDLAQILPEIKDYWDKDGKAWGNDDSNIIEASFGEGLLQEISFRVDLRNPDVTFIESLVRVAQSHDLLLFTEENTVLLPQLRTFIQTLYNSRAASFINDPLDYLSALEEIP